MRPSKGLERAVYTEGGMCCYFLSRLQLPGKETFLNVKNIDKTFAVLVVYLVFVCFTKHRISVNIRQLHFSHLETKKKGFKNVKCNENISDVYTGNNTEALTETMSDEEQSYGVLCVAVCYEMASLICFCEVL